MGGQSRARLPPASVSPKGCRMESSSPAAGSPLGKGLARMGQGSLLGEGDFPYGLVSFNPLPPAWQCHS